MRPRALVLAGRVAALAVLVGALSHHVIGAEQAAGDCSLRDGVSRSVVRVIDGETLVVDGGTEVRLVGSLAPRSSDAAAEAGDVGEAGWPLAGKAKAVLEELVRGRSVELGFAGRGTDRYGRLLAHVFVRDGEAHVWVQGELLKRGMARAYALEPNEQCLAELMAHEKIARDGGAGLWAETAYAVRSADDVDGLTLMRGSFQIVEGIVRAVAEVRGTTYVNFGEDYRQDFTITMRSGVTRSLTAGKTSLVELLKGRSVRVRGWVERRGGPMIEMHHPGELELLAVAEVDAAEAAERPAPARRSRSRRRPEQP